MAKGEWMYCGSEWADLINIIKLEKNRAERVREFHDMIKRDELTVEEVCSMWGALDKEEIESCAEGWFYDDDLYTLGNAPTLGNNSITYWFFNTRTGEAMRIHYSVLITCSGIVTV